MSTVGRTDRRPLELAAFVVLLVLVALVKPWGGSGDGTPAGAGIPFASVDLSAPGPSPTTPMAPPGSVPCYADTQWRIVVDVRSPGIERRAWFAATPLYAERASINEVRIRRVGARRIVALGICAPRDLVASGAVQPGTTAIWRVHRGRAVIRVRQIRLQTEVVPGVAELYLPPTGSSTWPAGRYLLQVPLGGGPTSHWFALEIDRPR